MPAHLPRRHRYRPPRPPQPLTTLETATQNRLATTRQFAPTRTAASIRSRRSVEGGLAIDAGLPSSIDRESHQPSTGIPSIQQNAEPLQGRFRRARHAPADDPLGYPCCGRGPCRVTRARGQATVTIAPLGRGGCGPGASSALAKAMRAPLRSSRVLAMKRPEPHAGVARALAQRRALAHEGVADAADQLGRVAGAVVADPDPELRRVPVELDPDRRRREVDRVLHEVAKPLDDLRAAGHRGLAAHRPLDAGDHLDAAVRRAAPPPPRRRSRRARSAPARPGCPAVPSPAGSRRSGRPGRGPARRPPGAPAARRARRRARWR